MTTFTATLYDGKDVPSYSKNIFTPEWADRLYRGIERNFDKPFEFVCVTDEPKESFAENVEVLSFKNYRHNMWCILECLRVTGDPVIFMGLDTIITGDITHMAEPSKFAMLKDPYQDRMCSGVMMWSDERDLYERFVEDPRKGDFLLAGEVSDMAWLEKHGSPDDLDERFPGQIRSYKVHVRNKGLGDARIVYFHGTPKPHELDEEWVTKHWSAS